MSSNPREELINVANIPIFDGEFIRPQQWQQPSPLPSIKTQQQLEAESIKLLVTKLEDLGVSVNYRPELDHRSFGRIRSFAPYVEVRSLADALDFFNRNTNSNEVVTDVAKALNDVVRVLNAASIKSGLDHVYVTEGDDHAGSGSRLD